MGDVHVCLTEMCSGVRGEGVLWGEPGREVRQTVSPDLGSVSFSNVPVQFLFGLRVKCDVPSGVQFVSPSGRSSSVQTAVNWFL